MLSSPSVSGAGASALGGVVARLRLPFVGLAAAASFVAPLRPRLSLRGGSSSSSAATFLARKMAASSL